MWDTSITAEEYKALKTKKKNPKYRNHKAVVDDLVFDSKKEAKRWCVLSLLQSNKIIKNLQRQVTFPLIVNGQLICKYRADFQYDENGLRIVEDVKGFKTPEYRLKAKLMKACLNIDIRET